MDKNMEEINGIKLEDVSAHFSEHECAAREKLPPRHTLEHPKPVGLASNTRNTEQMCVRSGRADRGDGPWTKTTFYFPHKTDSGVIPAPSQHSLGR